MISPLKTPNAGYIRHHFIYYVSEIPWFSNVVLFSAKYGRSLKPIWAPDLGWVWYGVWPAMMAIQMKLVIVDCIQTLCFFKWTDIRDFCHQRIDYFNFFPFLLDDISRLRRTFLGILYETTMRVRLPNVLDFRNPTKLLMPKISSK